MLQEIWDQGQSEGSRLPRVYSLPTSSYPDSRYRNHMGVAHSYCNKLLCLHTHVHCMYIPVCMCVLYQQKVCVPCTYQCFREEVELFSPLVHPGLDGSHVPGACYGGDIHLREKGRKVYMQRSNGSKDLPK